LRVGDTLVAGHVFCKVRAMVNDRLERVDIAGPSFAVEVLGMSDVPAAGDDFEVYVSEKEARSLADKRSELYRNSRLQQMMSSRRVTLNTLSAQAQEGELKELNLILKADVQGSLEAILGSLRNLPQQEVQVRVLMSAPGEITETDVDLAAASGAVIVGFSTSLASGARLAADNAGVDIREYDIIYNLLDDIQAAMEGLLDPEMVEEPLGQIEVRAVFQAGRGNIAGCYMLNGKAIRNCHIRIKRGNELVFTGILDSLKRMKDDVKEVNAGFECGVRLDRFNDWKEGDIIETFQMVSKRRTLTV
jgi:translation initiation factor IF-2